MKWYHEVSTEWLNARQGCITATDIVKMMPEYKRTKKLKPGQISPGFAGLWCEKNTIKIQDVSSYGDAARGHIMESWAVKSWNMRFKDKPMFHWDDCIIINKMTQRPIGFSPDALNIKHYGQTLLELHESDGQYSLSGDCDCPISMLEIKSYDSKHHMACCIEDKMKHKEVMQIAVAMLAVPTLFEANIMWFNPNAPIPIHVDTYTRNELENEIKLAQDIFDYYCDTCNKCEKLDHENIPCDFSEQQIWKEWNKEYADKKALESAFMI